MEPTARHRQHRPSVPSRAGHPGPTSRSCPRPCMSLPLASLPLDPMASHHATNATLLTPTWLSLECPSSLEAGWVLRAPEQKSDLPGPRGNQTATLGQWPGSAFGPPPRLRPFAHAGLSLACWTGCHGILHQCPSPWEAFSHTGLGSPGIRPPQPWSSERAGIPSVLSMVPRAYRRRSIKTRSGAEGGGGERHTREWMAGFPVREIRGS